MYFTRMLLFRNPSSSRLSSHLSSHATASSSANARVSRSSSRIASAASRNARAASVSPARRRRRAFFNLPNLSLELRTPLERERSRVHVTRRPVRGASVVRAREVRVVVVRAERVGQKPRVAAVVRRKRAAAVAGFRVLGSRQPRHLRARGSHQRLEVRARAGIQIFQNARSAEGIIAIVVGGPSFRARMTGGFRGVGSFGFIRARLRGFSAPQRARARLPRSPARFRRTASTLSAFTRCSSASGLS